MIDKTTGKEDNRGPFGVLLLVKEKGMQGEIFCDLTFTMMLTQDKQLIRQWDQSLENILAIATNHTVSTQYLLWRGALHMFHYRCIEAEADFHCIQKLHPDSPQGAIALLLSGLIQLTCSPQSNEQSVYTLWQKAAHYYEQLPQSRWKTQWFPFGLFPSCPLNTLRSPDFIFNLVHNWGNCISQCQDAETWRQLYWQWLVQFP